MKTLRVPKRSASQPDAGISTAIASEYATMTECMCSGLSPMSRAMAGSAVLTMVLSSVCMKKPSETSQSSLLRMGDSGAAAVEDSGIGGWYERQNEDSEGRKSQRRFSLPLSRQPRTPSAPCPARSIGIFS